MADTKNVNWIARLGTQSISVAKNVLYAFGFFWVVLRDTFRLGGRNRVGWQVFVMQILFTGVNALFIITLIAVSLGAVIIIEGSQLFSFGQNSLLYSILIAIITRELGPLLTAFIVMARSGVAIATELSNMVIAREIEAYIAVGINPISYLVVPRFLGVTVSLVALNLYFTLAGLAGSYIVVQLIHPLPASEYFSNLLNQLSVDSIVSSLLKSVAFGVVIAIAAAYNGFKAMNSTTEVPVLVIKAVGQGFGLLIVVNILITVVYLL